jgi:hypothetical protein
MREKENGTNIPRITIISEVNDVVGRDGSPRETEHHDEERGTKDLGGNARRE